MTAPKRPTLYGPDYVGCVRDLADRAQRRQAFLAQRPGGGDPRDAAFAEGVEDVLRWLVGDAPLDARLANVLDGPTEVEPIRRHAVYGVTKDGVAICVCGESRPEADIDAHVTEGNRAE